MRIETQSQLLGLDEADRLLGWAWHSFKTETVQLFVDGAHKGDFLANLRAPRRAPAQDRDGAFFCIDLSMFAASGRDPEVELRLTRAPQHPIGARARISELPRIDIRDGAITRFTEDGQIEGWVEEPRPGWSRPICRMVFNADHVVDFQAGSYSDAPQVFGEAAGFSFRLRVPPTLRADKRVTASLLVDTPAGWIKLAEQAAVVNRSHRATAVPDYRYTLALVDPSLREKRGHGYDLACRMSEIASARGVPITVASHRDFDPDMLENVDVAPIFRYSVYDHEPIMRGDGAAASLASELFKDLAKFKTAQGAERRLFIYPTVNHHLLQAIASLLQRTEIEPGEHHLMALMLESGLALDSATGERRVLHPDMASGYRQGLRALEASQPGAWTLSAISQTLADDFRELTTLAIRTAPPPLGFASVSQSPDTPKSDYQIGLYLGEVKLDKGFHFIGEIASRVLNNFDGVTLHAQVYGAHGNLGAAADTLQKLDALADRHNGLALYRDYMDSAAYRRLFAGLDAVVLAYDPNRYAGKTSGVFWEAAAMGAPIVAPENTWIAYEAERAGVPHYLFKEHTARSVFDAIGRLLADRPRKPGAATGSAKSMASTLFFDYCEKTYLSQRSPRRGATIAEKTDAARFGVLIKDREMLTAACDQTFVEGWGEPFLTVYNVQARWMGAEGVIRLFPNREKATRVRINGEGAGGPECLAAVKVWVDDDPVEARPIVMNEVAWRLDLTLDPVPIEAVRPVRITLKVEESPHLHEHTAAQKALLVSGAEFSALDDADGR